MMFDAKKDGGMAFPGKRPELVKYSIGGKSDLKEVQYPGMTLRQWYAGKALQGYLSSCNPGLPSDHAAAVIAEQAFKLADAMLAEDQKERN